MMPHNHPVWSTEFSGNVMQAGKKLACDENDGEELGCLFFEYEAGCTAIFELLKVCPEWRSTGFWK
ncbi:MAG: hypothetical protein K2M42_04180 [Oscillospiraceae bacterium]|nr:hypothetical protein [Oscillospiraceae bacterium]